MLGNALLRSVIAIKVHVYKKYHKQNNVRRALFRAVATGTVGPVFTGPLSGELSHVFTGKHHVTVQ